MFSPIPKSCAKVRLLGNTIFGIVMFARAVMLLVKLAQLGNTSPIERTVGVDVAGAMVEVTIWVTVTTSSWAVVAVVEVVVELLDVESVVVGVGV
jgi:hypothetical protein